MTVTIAGTRFEYVGNAVTTIFSFPAYFLASADLKVYLNGVLQTITTHYTVAGAGVPAGGSVTFLTPPPNGQSVVLFLDPAQTQGLDLVENDPLPAESLEKGLDRGTMIAQRLDDRIDRAARLSDSDISGASMILPTPVASRLLGWNSAATGWENYTPASISPLVAASAFMLTLLDDVDAAAARATLGVVGNETFLAKSGNYTLLTSDARTIIVYTNAAAATLTLPAAASAGVGFIFTVFANGAGLLTIDPDAAETVEGAATLVLAKGDRANFACDGSGWVARVTGPTMDGAEADIASAGTTDLATIAGRNIRVTGTTTITAFGTAPAGTHKRIRFASALTLTYNATALITPGAASLAILAGDTIEAVSLGAGNWLVTRWQTTPITSGVDIQAFTAGGTWTKPTGATKVFVQAWGPGGGGGRGGATNSGGGGGGGAYIERWFAASDLAATVAVTVPVGGLGATADDAAGASGSNTTFGAHVTAYGGGGGSGSGGTFNGGGGGGGQFSIGGDGVANTLGGAGGNPNGGAGGGNGVAGGAATTWGGGGGAGGAAAGGAAIYGGGGGGGGPNAAGSTAPGGASIWGGGGGGGGGNATSAGAGGVSTLAGNGGAGGFDANAGSNGSAPSGGGGGSESANAGNGARGQMIVTTWK